MTLALAILVVGSGLTITALLIDWPQKKDPRTPEVVQLREELDRQKKVNLRLHDIAFKAVQSRDAAVKRYTNLYNQTLDDVLDLDEDEDEH